MLALTLGIEEIWPQRNRIAPRLGRWISNIGVAAINSVLLGLIFPLLATGFALLMAEKDWGLLNLWDGPPIIEFVLAFVLLDFAIWAQHVVFHKVPLLWPLHAMHHADIDFDATTGVRFHPVEIVLSMIYKLGIIALLGPAAAAVIVFEVVLNGSALFNHMNLRLPVAVDRALRLVIVTPDMHRVHHSVHRNETDSNYGFCLSIWDRLLGTYVAQPRDGQKGMTIGLHKWRDLADTIGIPMLLLPLPLYRGESADDEGS